MILNTMAWFSLVALCLTQKRIRPLFAKFENALNKTFGAILIALGLKIAVSEK